MSRSRRLSSELGLALLWAECFIDLTSLFLSLAFAPLFPLRRGRSRRPRWRRR